MTIAIISWKEFSIKSTHEQLLKKILLLSQISTVLTLTKVKVHGVDPLGQTAQVTKSGD